MQKLNPTRINLINLRKRVAMANKGYSILKRKREVLVLEFLKLLKQSKNDRDYLNSLLRGAYKTVAIAATYAGNLELGETAIHMDEAEPVRMSIRNVMGVKVPEMAKPNPVEISFTGYSLFSTSVAIDDITDSFSKVRDVVADVAQREQGLKRIVLEIEKTKRRVNALDYIVIPQMKGQAKYIRMRLEEMDRDTFSALKHVKKKLAR